MNKIVHCKKSDYDLYIGRGKCPKTGKIYPFGNPYVIGTHGNRAEVIEKFKQYAPTNKDLMDNLRLIDNKILGCWCNYPEEDCHGRILCELREKQKMESNQTKKYRVGIVGSRNFNNKDFIFEYLDKHIEKIGHIVSGGAKSGGDFWANEYAKERGLSITVHYAKWKRDDGSHDKGAGFRRNFRIINDSEIILAFWDGQSHGTAHTIEQAKQKGKKVIIIKVEPDKE